MASVNVFFKEFIKGFVIFSFTVFIFTSVSSYCQKFDTEKCQITGLYGGTSVFEFADIDNDGDLDAFCQSRFFCRNIGSSENPQFEEKSKDFFNLQKISVLGVNLVDIDGDGDLDNFSSTIGTKPAMCFQRNTGTPEQPVFLNGDKKMLFGISTDYDWDWVNFVDIDGDGDLDFFGFISKPTFKSLGMRLFFQENIGSATDPKFNTATESVFGLPASHLKLRFFDVDGDGDFDAFVFGAMDIKHPENHLYMMENTGSASFPMFETLMQTPYGIDSQCQFHDIDNDGDLDAIENGYTSGIYGADVQFFYYKNLEIEQ